MSISIGITERGDPCLDFSWIKLIDYVDGAIIISKGYNEDFNSSLLKYKDKIIYHATCTGLGSTILEPNVPFFINQIENIEKIIEKGFPVNQIVIRIDPIIPKDIFFQLDIYNKNNCFKLDVYDTIITDIIRKCINLGIRRFRYSFLDLYPHVIKRLEERNIKTKGIKEERSFWINIFQKIEKEMYFKDKGIELKNINPNDLTVFFEACAENTIDYHRIGCVSKRDFEILKLNTDEAKGSSNQRPLCLCCSAKKEMLTNKKQCPHECLYCYWK